MISHPKVDAVIVGGGIAGLSTAYHLAQSNLKVVLFDKEISFDLHSSGRNAGIFRQIEADEGIALLARDTRRELDKIFGGETREWLNETGATYIADNAADISKLEDIAKRVGVTFEHISEQVLHDAGFHQEIRYGMRVVKDGIIDTHQVLSRLYRSVREKEVERLNEDIYQMSEWIRILERYLTHPVNQIAEIEEIGGFWPPAGVQREAKER